MSDTTSSDAPQVLIEFPQKAGIQQVTLKPEDVSKKSAEALDAAMTTIQQMSDKVTAAVRAVAQKPSEVEIEFGLKFDVETGVLIAKTGVEAGLNVTLKWDLTEKK
jgi:hypothetical protein